MSSHADTNEPKLVTIRVFSNEMEANLAKAALEAFGIDCVLSRDDCGGQRPNLAVTGGLGLVVRAEDAESAADILKPQPEAS